MRLLVNAAHPGHVINRNIYGHFSEHLGRCIYEGLFVGDNPDIPNTNGMRNDVADALRHIRIPVLRWPGGCFADEYHWQDGIGTARKRMVNTHWGGVTEDNSFGTHEFMELCRQLECEPYVNGNVGSGTVREMSEWVEYMTLGGVSPMADLRAQNGHAEPWKLKYFAVGNENWGCGGNMRPEYYADEYRRYATYVRNYGDNKIYKVACGPNGDDYNWTDVLMERAGRHMDALSLHYYTVPGSSWKAKGPAVGFAEDIYYQTLEKTLFMDDLIENHSRIMSRHDPQHRVGLVVDEWGTWYDVEQGTNPGFLYQQNTMRDALVAAINLNIFNRHCDRVVMANLAQTVNVLQAVILTDGAKMLLTPTYHVFDLYKVHQGARLVETHIAADTIGGEHAVPRLHTSASLGENGALHITVANLSATETQAIEADLGGFKAQRVTAVTLSGDMNCHNTFDAPNNTHIRPLEAALTPQGVSLTLPACGVTRITVE